jgi:TPR repeat protein
MVGLITTTQAAIESMETNVLDSKGRAKDDPRYMEIRNLEEQEQRGISLYRSGKHKKAYEVLSEPASLGLKRAQHSIALMHIQGQSVEKNLLIGTALFGLAAESGDRKLLQEHTKLLKLIPEKFKLLVQQQTDYYIERYGMETQGIVCAKEKPLGSHLAVVECRKQPGTYKEYPWAP